MAEGYPRSWQVCLASVAMPLRPQESCRRLTVRATSGWSFGRPRWWGETPRVDAPAGWRGDGDARASRAAESDAGDRLPHQHLARAAVGSVCRRIPPGTKRNRLCRGTKSSDRIPLGGGPPRSAARISRRSRRPQRRRDRSIRHPFGSGGEKRNIELMAKRLDLLSELVPQARVIALLVNPTAPIAKPVIREVQEAARAKGMQLHILKVTTESEIDAAFASLVQMHADALVVSTDPFFFSRRDQLLMLATHHAVPAMYYLREFVAAGGLISYGTSFTSLFRQVGIYAGKILNGAKPADLPVEQPTRFELVINLKTAKAL